MQEREIQTISFGRACRDRIGMYLSADPQEALQLGLREVYVNSLDALLESKQTKGTVSICINTKERTIKVTDDGPGIPNNKRDDKIPALVAAYTMAHTGSHFDGRETNAIGVNGVGASVVAHTSDYFRAESINKGESCVAIFKGSAEGAQLETFIPTKTKEHSGVSVEYIPSEDVYQDAWFNQEILENELTEMMKFYPRYKIELTFDGKTKTIFFPKGLKEDGTQLYYESDNLILSLGLGDGEIKPFGNRLYLPNGGAFFSHFRSQFTRKINELSGLKLSGGQIQAVFRGYIAIFVSNPLFSNQSKTAISNKDVNSEITYAINQELEKFSQTKEWEKVIKELETELKAEQAAEKAREKIRNAMSEIAKGARKKIVAPDKLKDCLNTGKGTWLAIAEGDSAANSLCLGRDIENVAVFPIRGKFVNTLKNTKEKYLDNQELIQISQILGAGLCETFNINKMKYENILICTDADEDGKSISNLLITFFYVCMPELLRQGRVYRMKAPLYYKQGEYVFDEAQWAKVKKKAGFVRAKGLGEYSSNAVEEALFGEHKQWIQLKPKSWESVKTILTDLMGKDTSPRQDILFNKIDFERIKFL